jgi:hypothetical protein
MRALPLLLAAALLLPVAAQASHDMYVPTMRLLAQGVPDSIRPGAWMSSPSNCTMAFVVRDTASRLYITTAAHCVDFVGQPVSLWEEGRIGTVRAMAGVDMALVEIDPAKYDRVNPTMVGWGGPTGMATGPVAEGTPLLHYGWGYLGTWVVDQTRCRPHVFFANDGARYEGLGQISSGDSGSPIMTADGKAMGLTNWGFGIVVQIPGYFGGPRFDQGLAALEGASGLDLELVTGEPVRPVCLEL